MWEHLESLAGRVRDLFTFGVVSRTSATGQGQRVQVRTSATETTDDLPHIEPFGFTSNPKDGAEALVFPLNEDEEIVLVVADRRYRIKGLARGEVALYDTEGQSVIFRTAPTRLAITSGDVRVGSDSASKGAARNGDAVRVSIPAGTVVTAATGAVLNPAPILLDGTIIEGSATVKVED